MFPPQLFPPTTVPDSYCVPVGGSLLSTQLGDFPACCSSAGKPQHRLRHPWCTRCASYSCIRGGCPSCLPNNTHVAFFLHSYSLKGGKGYEETEVTREKFTVFVDANTKAFLNKKNKKSLSSQGGAEDLNSGCRGGNVRKKYCLKWEGQVHAGVKTHES